MPETRERYWKAFEASRRPYEARMEQDAFAVLDAIGEEAARLIAANGILTGQERAEMFIQTEAQADMLMFYERAYGIVVPVFAEETFAAIRRSQKQETVWRHAVRQWIAKYGAELVVRITATTMRTFRRLLDETVLEGVGTEEIARRLHEAWTDISRMRARRIARTEIVRASNFGSITGARQIETEMGLTLRKEWIETFDERTRDSHFIDQVVGMEEPFMVGGYEAMYPGDPALPPEESINCRCTLAYVTE